MNANFLPILDWTDAKCGDIGFYAGASVLSDLIEEFQPGTGPDGSWSPSHAFIVRDQDSVVEADASGMCEVASAEKYAAGLPSGQCALFRPTCDVMPLARAALLNWMVQKYGNRPYPWWNLIGFGIQRLFGLADNPISCGDVCSQIAWFYLSYLDAALVAGLRRRDCDPVKLFDLVSGAHP